MSKAWVDNILWDESNEPELRQYLEEAHTGKLEKEIVRFIPEKELKQLSENIGKDLQKFLFFDCVQGKAKKLSIGKKTESYRVLIKAVPKDRKSKSKKSEPSFYNESELLYNMYGVFICSQNDSIVVYVNLDYKPSSDAERAEFVDYYQRCTSKFVAQLKEEEAAFAQLKEEKTAFDQWQTKHQGDVLNPKISEKLGDKILSPSGIMDRVDDAPLFFQILAIPAAFTEVLAKTAAGVLIGVAGIGEIAARTIAEELKNGNFDKKHLSVAQQQFVEIKLFDYFKGVLLQQKNSLENRELDFDEL